MSLIIDLIGYRVEERTLLNSINSTLNSYKISIYKQPLKPQDDFYGITSLPSLEWRSRDFIHLQYIYVKLKEGLGLELNVVYDDPEIKLELLNKHRNLGESHLICHGCYDGYFVPIDFKDVKLPSSILVSLGSSINLRNELLEIASNINFDLHNYFKPKYTSSNEEIFRLLSEKEIYKLYSCEEKFVSELFWYEKRLLLELYNVVLASLRYSLVVSLCG